MKRVRVAVATVVAVSALAAGSVVAYADPDAVSQARKDLDRIQQESSSIDQSIIEAYDRSTENQAKLKTLTADVKTQEAKVATLSSQLGDVGQVQMRSDSFSLTAQLLTSSGSDNFLSGLGVLQVETDRSNTAIQQLQVDQAKLTALREDASRTQEQLDKDAAAKVSLGKDYDKKEAEAQAVYNRLSAEERARLDALEAQRVQEAQAAQAADESRAQAATTASRSRDVTAETSPSAAPSPSASASAAPAGGDDTPTDPPAGGGSGRTQQVVDAALSKVGRSYVWGTSGPNTFDCSGLTSWAYRQVGISITRSSKGQFSSVGTKVSKSDLQPGDLVFYYSPVSHVGLYIGNGKIVHAANPRSGVRVAPLNSMPFSGARRVIG